jgi:hypothetical protein
MLQDAPLYVAFPAHVSVSVDLAFGEQVLELVGSVIQQLESIYHLSL